MEEFTPADANAVHHASQEALHQAGEREERMPTAAKVLRSHAERLKIVRDKILDRLPPEIRKAYPK